MWLRDARSNLILSNVPRGGGVFKVKCSRRGGTLITALKMSHVEQIHSMSSASNVPVSRES